MPVLPFTELALPRALSLLPLRRKASSTTRLYFANCSCFMSFSRISAAAAGDSLQKSEGNIPVFQKFLKTSSAACADIFFLYVFSDRDGPRALAPGGAVGGGGRLRRLLWKPLVFLRAFPSNPPPPRPPSPCLSPHLFPLHIFFACVQRICMIACHCFLQKTNVFNSQ